jgi:Anti-sigma factor NepR
MRRVPEDFGLTAGKMRGHGDSSMPGKTSKKSRKGARKTAPAGGAEAAKTDQYIADQLKAMYDAVTVEPVPDHLLRLLDRLDNDAEE